MSSVSGLVFFVALLFAVPAWACQPCHGTRTLEESLRNAELVVIARAQSASAPVQPETVTLAIEQTLKGKPDHDIVIVKSWYGMCPYGVQLEPGKKALVMLVRGKPDSGSPNSDYEGLNFRDERCGISLLEISGSRIKVDKQWMELRAFTDRYLSAK